MKSINAFLFVLALVAGLASVPTDVALAANPPEKKKTALRLDSKPFHGDFESMKKRRIIRVAVPYSRTLFFNDRGVLRGITAENLQEFERWLNKKYKTGAYPITVYAIPVTRDRMLPMLNEGKADIVAGNLTIIAERDKHIDFTDPLWGEVTEIVVTGPSSPLLVDIDDLAGKEVHVRPASSYHASLKRLNEEFRRAGKPEMLLRLMPDALEDEDMLDMLNAGMVGIVIVDDWKARAWAGALKKITLHPEMKVSEGGRIGWGFRENSPQLAAVLNEYIATINKSGVIKSRLASYQRRLKALKNPTTDSDWQRFEQAVELFKIYGERYQFDYLMMTAQGFQESGLNQAARSPVGAIGIMQLMPATGAELNVGDIRVAEANVHAGIKYMRKLIEVNFPNADFDETNRTLIAFAAYNAGPGRIARLRKEAEKEGLSPDKWFNNLELVAARRVGQETVGYVRNIYKYYTAYKLQLEVLEARRSALRGTGAVLQTSGP